MLMHALVDSAILIPSLPILLAFLMGVLLVSFNRTINRLTKPISFLLINSIFASTLYSAFLLYKNISGTFSIQPLRFFNIDYILNSDIDNSSETALVVIGITALIVMILSFVKLPRSRGYVRYLISLSLLFGTLFIAALTSLPKMINL